MKDYSSKAHRPSYAWAKDSLRESPKGKSQSQDSTVKSRSIGLNERYDLLAPSENLRR
jgi:hypothetical protein